MTEKAPSQFWMIQHPASSDNKKTIAQFDTVGETVIPDDIVEYDEFVIKQLDNRSELTNSVDQSTLNDKELDLLSQIYPVTVE